MANASQTYKFIEVELAAMRSLAEKLHSDGRKLERLLLSLREDVREVGFKWEDENYAKFLLYFLDRLSGPLSYHDFVQDQAEWLDKAIPEYESLPGDIQASMGEALGRYNL